MREISIRCLHWISLLCWIVFVWLFLGDLAYAAEQEKRQRIEQVASDYARSQAGEGKLDIRARLPDSRLSLPRCKDTPVASAARYSQRMQVRVSCPGSWALYVPVTISQQKQLVVLNRSLASGEIVSASDISLRWQAVSDVGYGHFEDTEGVIGRRLARPVRAGQILRPNQLRQAFSVRKGDTVTLISRIAGVEIRSRGTAEHDAVENARVNVRNLSSGKRVQGYARGSGIVEVQG